MAFKLFVVPTPIGNLEDMTFRAVRILKEADLVLAEDTRTSSKLLNHYEIETPLSSYHMHNEHKKVVHLVEQIKQGKKMTLVSDAGTPAISDPGFLLVRECLAQGVEVECLPGATAFVPALVNSGIPCNEFVFIGFLPIKKGRKMKLEQLALEEKTIVLYESPHKIVKTLTDLVAFFGPNRPASLSRELSKKFEENIRGTLSELLVRATKKTLKGEMVLVLAGKS